MDNKDVNQNENQKPVQQENPEQSLSQNANQGKNQEPVQQPAGQKEKFVLVVKNKTNGLETIYTLEDGKELIIGAGPECSVCVEDPYISSRHFSVKLKDGKLEVEDLKSTNGLYLLVDKPVTVSCEAVLLAGKTTFKFEKRTGDGN